MARLEPAAWWAVRRAQSLKPATYRCPLCGYQLHAMSPHVLLSPEGDTSRRRHAHAEFVEAARRTPQTVTKHGKPAVVVVDVVEYERLRCLERARAPSFADLLLAMPQDDGEFSRRDVRMRALDL